MFVLYLPSPLLAPTLLARYNAAHDILPRMNSSYQDLILFSLFYSFFRRGSVRRHTTGRAIKKRSLSPSALVRNRLASSSRWSSHFPKSSGTSKTQEEEDDINAYRIEPMCFSLGPFFFPFFTEISQSYIGGSMHSRHSSKKIKMVSGPYIYIKRWNSQENNNNKIRKQHPI